MPYDGAFRTDGRLDVRHAQVPPVYSGRRKLVARLSGLGNFPIGSLAFATHALRRRSKQLTALTKKSAGTMPNIIGRPNSDGVECAPELFKYRAKVPGASAAARALGLHRKSRYRIIECQDTELMSE